MYQLIPTCTWIFFVSAVLLCFGRSCHHSRGQGGHTHCVWAGERAPLLSWGNSNLCPCRGEWFSFCVTQQQYNSRGFSKPWGLDPCSFTDSLNCSHEVCSPQASIALACCKGQKRLIQRKLCANNSPHWHHCFYQDNHLSPCLSSLILRYEEPCLALLWW